MEGTVLVYAVRKIKPVMLLFAVFLLLRGHNEPGGGFIGGLIAASAFILEAISEGPETTRKKLWFSPLKLSALGLSLIVLSLIPAIVAGADWMQGFWLEVPLPAEGKLKLGTPLLFDFGVFFAVVGFSLNVMFVLMEEWKWK